MNEHARLWHPWLRVERLTRLAVAARMREPDDEADHALMAILVRRREVERASSSSVAGRPRQALHSMSPPPSRCCQREDWSQAASAILLREVQP